MKIRNRKRIRTIVDSRTYDIVKLLSQTKGQSISEYIRGLIIEDLDSRSVYTTELKKQLVLR